MKNISVVEKDKINSLSNYNKRNSVKFNNTTTANSQFKNVNKIYGIDKEQILREFSAYQNNSRSVSKLMKATSLDKSLSNTSKGKAVNGSNLIPIKTIKVKKEESGKRTMNVSQNDHNRSRDKVNKNYEEMYRRYINKKELNFTRLNSSGASMEIEKLKKKPANLHLNTIRTENLENTKKSRVKNKKINLDIYDLYKACFPGSTKTEHKYNKIPNFNPIAQFSTLKNTLENEDIDNSPIQDNSRKLTNYITNKISLKEISSNQTINNNLTEKQNKILNENYTKYYQHLEEKLSFLSHKINDYTVEKQRLDNIINDSKTEKSIYVKKLENEIQSYKNMIDSCVKTCSQLTEEIMGLKKDIGKYTTNSNYYSETTISNITSHRKYSDKTRNFSSRKNTKGASPYKNN